MRVFPLSILLACVCVCACDAALAPPVFNPGGGLVHSPAFIAITNPNSTGTIFYTTDGSDPRDVFGGVTALARSYRGALNVNRSTIIRARVKTDQEWSDLAVGAFTADQDFSKLIFTEVMYHPQNNTDDTEYVELKNVGTKALNLTGLRFAALLFNGVDAQFDIAPQTWIRPGEFLLLVAHTPRFLETYPPVRIDGDYSDDVENSLGRLTLRSAANAEAAWMEFESAAPWQVVPDNHGYFANDGVGFSLVRTNNDPESDPSDPWTWRASSARLGSPGVENPAPTVPPVYINELRTRSAIDAPDAVEFFNPNPFDVNIGGWWLSDERNDPKRYRIPPNTTIVANNYFLLDETQFGAAISFGADGERCYLFSADANGELTGYSHGLQFFASEADVTFGRYVTSDGTEYFVPQTLETLDGPNAGPKIPPVVISEIMYRPQTGAPAYIELRNVTDAPVQLWDPLHPEATWRVEWINGATHVPPGITLPPQGHLVFSNESAVAFRARYNVPAGVPIIFMPPVPNHESSQMRLLRPAGRSNGVARYIEVELIDVSDRAPWPPGAVGGPALERISMTAFGGDSANWRVSPTLRSPGVANSGNLPPAVWAGNDRMEFVGHAAPLVAAVADDRWPGASLVSEWSRLSGPAPVQFADSANPQTTATFSAAGEYVLQLQANDGASTSTDTVVITVIAPPFDAWQASVFTGAELANPAISGPLADPDRDARTNVAEYLHASDPKQPNQESLPSASIVNGRLQIRWIERSGVPDVVVKPERADRLEGPWFDSSELFTWTRVDQSGFSEVTVSERLPMGSRGAGFMRLRLLLR